jgi:hypothetical protein
MVIDKGLGLNAIDDLMQVAAPVIDVLKLTFGTSAFFGRDVLKEKVRTVTAHGVYCMPAGPSRRSRSGRARSTAIWTAPASWVSTRSRSRTARSRWTPGREPMPSGRP